MKRGLVSIAALAMLVAGQAAAGEMDMSKLTCKDLSTMTPGQIAGVGLWLSGYAHGKAGTTVVNSDTMQANADKFADYCSKNPDANVLDVVAQVAK